MKKFVLAFLAVLLATTASVAAETVLVDMVLGTPSPTQNTMAATFNIADLGFPDASATTTTTVSGTTKVNLGIDADPITNEVTGVSTIQLVYQPGVQPVAWGNMSFYIDIYPEVPNTYWVSLDTANMAGTFNQKGGDHVNQGPPISVTGGKFDLSQQEFYVDHGTMVMAGTIPSLMHPDFPSPLYWDMSVPNGAAFLRMENVGTGNSGSVGVSLQDVVGNLATYDVDLVMKVKMDVNLWYVVPPYSARMGNLASEGTIVMHGEMTRTVNLAPDLPGDANGDGFVDNTDAAILAAHWHQSGVWAQGDFNDDGQVNDKDASILAAYWTGPPAEGQAEVPEASTLVGLIGMALAGAIAWRRR